MEKKEVIPKIEAKRQVQMMAGMMASLFYHMSREIVNALGQVEGEKLITKAVDEYGAERGAEHRKYFEKNGLPLSPESYVLKSDLPQLGWDVENPRDKENATHTIIHDCPMAHYWMKRNFHQIGKLYCRVDQAKYTAFHPDSDLVHLKHILKGDPYCEMVCRRKK